jgi:hypothetical protein
MTLDMTNNRVPYGLLTDEEKAALHEHEKAGGKFEYYGGTMWSVTRPNWLEGFAYRTVPLPKTQDVIAWDRLPEWVEWVARDSDGGVFGYDFEPKSRDEKWPMMSRYRRIDDFPGIVQIGTCDWLDSKQRRPQK